MTKEERKERRREYLRKWRAGHREEFNERQRNRKREWRAEHREEYNRYMRKLRAERPEEFRERQRRLRAEHRDEYIERSRKYKSQDLNKQGVRKCRIRAKSKYYLFRKHSKHAKLEGYEIHHCFGYEDYKKFIYIPKRLHLQIHQLLRDNNIPAESDHWMAIRELVNSCDEYTYISC